MKKPTPPKSRIIYEKVVTFYDQYILFALSLILAGSTVFFWIYFLFFK